MAELLNSLKPVVFSTQHKSHLADLIKVTRLQLPPKTVQHTNQHNMQNNLLELHFCGANLDFAANFGKCSGKKLSCSKDI